jgi:pimeloyl-ACP methyl ester carboxylesterase/membrane-associated phospholipid phosphatase
MLWLDYYWHKVLRRPYTLARRIDKGRGQPVVFLHGIASNGQGWQYAADFLDEKKYRTIAFDLLGFGDSPQPSWLQYSVEDHAESVLASLRRLGIRKPVILVGHSMGSLVASHIAHEHPRKVKRLILYQMPIYSAVPKLAAKDFRRQAYLSVFGYLAEHPKTTLLYARVLGRVASKLGGFNLTEKTWQPFELSLRNTIMQQQSYEDLRALRMQTDVIYGRYDILVLRKNLQHFFHPSKHLHFYEVDELHRISARAGQLIAQLISNENELDTKHVRRVELIHMKELETKNPPKEDNFKWFLAASMAALIFIICAAGAWHGNLTEWEKQAFLWLNGWQAPGFIKFIARKRYTKSAWRVAVPAGAAYTTEYITSHIVQRLRPEGILAHDTILRAAQDGYGFPSGHMATMTAVTLTVWPYLSWPLRVAIVGLTVLVGWSRIYLGVHFPLDILGGFAIGVAVVCCIKVLPVTLKKRLRLI